MSESRRQLLWRLTERGDLRQIIEMHGQSHGFTHDAIDLLVDIVARYCEPRRRRK